MTSIDALDLPLQLFALGTALGMTSALIQHARTGEVDHWPVHVAIVSLLFFYYGLMQTVV